MALFQFVISKPQPWGKHRSLLATVMFLLTFILLNTCQMSVHRLPTMTMSFAGEILTKDALTDLAHMMSWPHEGSDLASDPGIDYAKLSNGVRVVLMKNSEPKDRVSMHLVIQSGSLHETDDQEGLAHFLEHMLFNGSTHFPPGELVKYFQMIGMKFGPDANAHTGFNETVYDVLLPLGDHDNIEKGLLVFKDYAQGAFLLPEEIERERRVILAEKRNRDSADYRTMIETLKFEFPEARLSKRLPIGDEEDIRATNQESMKAFYDAWYRPEKMVVVIVGDFDIETVKMLVREKMSDIHPRHPPLSEPDFGRIDHHGVKPFYHFEPEAGNASVSIEMIMQVEKAKDSSAFRREELYRNMAVQIVQNRLEKLISDPKTPFTSAHITSGRFLEQVFYSEISAESPPEKWKASLHQIEQTLRKALAFGFTPGELTRVKKEYISGMDNAVRQSATRKSGQLARRIIRNVNNDRVMLSPRQEKELLTPWVDAATLADVHSALKKCWPASHRLVLLTGNARVDAKAAGGAEAIILSVYQDSEKQSVQKHTESALKPFPYLPIPEGKGNIVSRTKLSELDIVQIEFDNGIRLNLKKTDFEAGKVRASVVLGKGRSREPLLKPGLVSRSIEVLNESGLGGMDKNELSHAMAGSDVEAWYSAEEDKYTISGTAPTKKHTMLVQLLHAYLLDPAFRQDALSLVQARTEQEYHTLEREVDGALRLQGQKFLAGGDKRFGLPVLEDLKKLSLADMKSWMLKIFTQAPLEISVVGEFEEKSIIDAVAIYFGTLPKRTAGIGSEEQRPLPTFPTGKSLAIGVDTKIQKGLVVFAYPTTDFWNIHRTRRLSVLASVFSERMREKIREELGASYSPFAFNRSSRAYTGYGLLQAFVYIAPDDASKVIDVLKDITRDLLKNGISRDEMLRSLKPILTGIKDYRRTNRYWLDSVMSGSSWYPQQLEWSLTFMSDYESITAEEVHALAKQYLSNEKAATVVIHPEQVGESREDL